MDRLSSPFDGFRQHARRGGVITYAARFGIGADQATGTGAFDTSLYAGSTPANGTYGNFSVTSGVITPNGSQTAGTYDVGGWPVQVISGYKAVANQPEMDALTPANSSGKTVLIREAAALTVGTSWNPSGDFGYATILGDGPDYRGYYLDAAKDSRKHFISFVTNNTKKLILDSLNFVTGSAAGAKIQAVNFSYSGGSASDIYVLRCRIICSRPNLFGDYTAGHTAFPGSSGITFASCTRASVRDNVVHGAYDTEAAIAMQAVSGWAECVGNHVDVFYGDALRMPGSRCLVSSNLVTRPMAAGGDALDPHADVIQFIGGEAVVEGLGAAEGDTRGNGFWQSFFASDATDYRIMLRDSVVSDASLYAYTINAAQGSTIENCVWLPKPGTSLPIGGTKGGMRYYHTSGTNELKNSVHRAGSALIDGGITQTGVVSSSSWNATDYGNNFPAWDYGTTVPTLQSLLGTIGQGAAAAAGKSPRIASMGAERSSIVYNLTAPVLSSLSLTPAADGFTGTVASTQVKAPIFWVAVTNGSPVPDYRQIKERKATGGVVYGDGWVTGATLALTTNGLSPSTTYTVHAVQETGYSVQSNILSANITTTAAGITRIGVGTFNSVDNSNSIGLNIPTAINGDYLVAIVTHARDQAVPTTPSGWTLIGDGATFAVGGPEIAVFGRTRTGSEGSTLNISFSGFKRILGFVAAYRTVNGTLTDSSGAEATGTVFNATSRATPSLTATANSCILHIWTHWPAGGTVTLPNAGDLIASGYTPDTAWFLGAENLLSTSAGATATRTASSTANETWNTMQVELLKA